MPGQCGQADSKQAAHAKPPRSSITTAAAVNGRRRRCVRDRPDGGPGLADSDDEWIRSIRNQPEYWLPRGSRGRPVGRCAGHAAVLGVGACLYSRECTRERWPWATRGWAAYRLQPAGDLAGRGHGLWRRARRAGAASPNGPRRVAPGAIGGRRAGSGTGVRNAPTAHPMMRPTWNALRRRAGECVMGRRREWHAL